MSSGWLGEGFALLLKGIAMCLYVDRAAGENLLASGKQYITAYKVLKRTNEYAPGTNFSVSILSSPVYHLEWRSGLNKSKTRRPHGLAKGNRVYAAIHVYAQKKVACDRYCITEGNDKSRFVVIPVRCYLKDLIGVQTRTDNSQIDELAFRKVYLSKRAYAKALKGESL